MKNKGIIFVILLIGVSMITQVDAQENFLVEGSAIVHGNLDLSTDSTNGTSINLFNASDTSENSSNQNWRILNTGTGNDEGPGQLIFDQANVAARMMISSDGNIGIGTTFPGAKIHVVGNAIVEGLISEVADPVENQDVATKHYVDNLLLEFGLSIGTPEAIAALLHIGIGLQELLDRGLEPAFILEAGADTSQFIGLDYQGGLIFDFHPNATGYIISPSDITTTSWGCKGVEIIGIDSVEIGYSNYNTQQIINGCPTPSIAADTASNYLVGGHTGWSLPTTEALQLAYNNLHLQGMGNFEEKLYWTSVGWAFVTQVDLDYAMTISFEDGGIYGLPRDYEIAVRAIRYFEPDN